MRGTIVSEKIKILIAFLLSVIGLPLTYLSLYWLKLIRKVSLNRQPMVRKAIANVGIFPMRDHYYEPLFQFSTLPKPLNQERDLPGIDWNTQGQLALLQSFHFQNELTNFPKNGHGPSFSFENDTFRAGDAEFLYSLVRTIKPQRIFEIGSGNSTLVSLAAIETNKTEDPAYKCQFVAIEPYERPWLKQLPIELKREKVETIDTNFFKQLQAQDILFIDSSHMIRPQGDVLTEYLEIIPKLNPGVWVHVHDIFSPRDYLTKWLKDDMKLWNEQYLLEAFLCHNHRIEIKGALNYLKHGYSEHLEKVFPIYKATKTDCEPGSFWFQVK
jgi:hypothetical protein